MPEEPHQGLEGDAGVDERGGVGVAELVWSHVSDPGDLGGPGEFFADRGLGEAPAVVGEQELCGSPGAGVWQRPPGGAGAGDAVEQGDGFVVEGNHPFGVEFPEWDFQPGAVSGDFVDAVEFQVEEFTDAQSDGAGE